MYSPVRPSYPATRLSNNRSRRLISIRQLRRAAVLGLALFVAGIVNHTFAQSPVFTYQGRLQDGGVAANGSYDFRFTLWDASSGGTQQPQPGPVTVNVSNVTVTAGNFSVQLDFGRKGKTAKQDTTKSALRLTSARESSIIKITRPLNIPRMIWKRSC